MIVDRPRIHSARLDLVPLRRADAAIVFDDAKDPALYRYLQQRPPASLADLEALFARWEAGSADQRLIWLNWIAIERRTNERVGLLQATIDVARRTGTIGYSIFARFQGRRFAREAAEAMVLRLRARGDIDCAVAEISEPNRHSRAVVESLGFTLTGRIVGAGREDGRICDDAVYTLNWSILCEYQCLFFRERGRMKSMMQKFARTLAVLAILALPATALADTAPIGTSLLGSQTVLNGTLEQDLSSKTSQVNDPFVLDVQAPYPGDDQRLVGAKILGHVAEVSHAGGTRKGGLTLAFDRLLLADGTEASLTGTLISAQETKGGNTAGRAIIGALIGQVVGNYIGKHIGSDVGGAVGAIGGGIYAGSLGTNITLGKGTMVKLQTTEPTTVTGRRQTSYGNTPSYAQPNSMQPTPQAYPQPQPT